MRRTAIAVLVACLVLPLVGLGAVGTLAPDASALLAADGQCERVHYANGVEVERVALAEADWPASCVTALATLPPDPTATAISTPTNTPVPPTVSGWHAPTTHEHGDAPPQWVNAWIAANAASYGAAQLVYGGDEATSVDENGMKHAAFKGVLMTSPVGTQVYLRYHAAANPMDRSAQFHSYEAWWRDTRGGVSFLQGWYDTGDPAPYPQGDRVPRRLGDPGQRPIMLVVDQQTQAQLGNGTCEQWYMAAAIGLADFAVTICGVPYLYNASENATAHDASTWQRNPSGGFGLHRRAESFIFPNRLPAGFSGAFWATPQGQACVAGQAGCLYQYIAPTLRADARTEFGILRISTLVEKTFPSGPNITPVN